jgi:NADH-quinone oxidoreductase subunit E
MEQTTESAATSYEDLLSRYPHQREYLIPLLQDIQDRDGYLSEGAIHRIAGTFELSEAKILGVATFYNQFKLVAPGKYRIQICRGTACHVKGSFSLLETLTSELGILPGETSRDGLFSLETVACVGACSIAPVITINSEFHGRLDKKKLLTLIKDIRAKENADE